MPADFDRASFRSRLARLRRDRFGDDGVAGLALELGIPARTWENYEMGVAVPDVVLLRFLCLTGVGPSWLLNGRDDPRPAIAMPPTLPR